MYFDEDLLLDLRLNSLNKYIKKFVITEATYTHNGNKKKLNFDINNFKKFKDKIEYIVVDTQPQNILKLVEGESRDKRGEKLILNGMARDYFQRENLAKGLREAANEDLILISDLDEIPNLDSLNFSDIKNNIVIFEQKMFYYKLNLFYSDFIWQGTKATKSKNFLSPQWLRNIKGKKYPKWRIDTFFSKKRYCNLIFVKNGGWHFTCLRTAEELEKKLLNFAHHYEYEESGLKINDLKKMITEKRSIYDHNVDQKGFKWSGKSILKKIKNDELPYYINNNLEKYKDWLD
jgi:beta-1,4-mannosyl-glycoprotein beta-1,4-N-acetylglucosaminyltransferase|tara:strand:- start:1710 stop:2579 length:870 start_codon:yes stop_codon:yes gene_type:complete